MAIYHVDWTNQLHAILKNLTYVPSFVMDYLLLLVNLDLK